MVVANLITLVGHLRHKAVRHAMVKNSKTWKTAPQVNQRHATSITLYHDTATKIILKLSLAPKSICSIQPRPQLSTCPNPRNSTSRYRHRHGHRHDTRDHQNSKNLEEKEKKSSFIMGLAFAAFMLPIRAIQGLFAVIVLGLLAYCKRLPSSIILQLLIDTLQPRATGHGGGRLPRSTS